MKPKCTFVEPDTMICSRRVIGTVRTGFYRTKRNVCGHHAKQARQWGERVMRFGKK